MGPVVGLLVGDVVGPIVGLFVGANVGLDSEVSMGVIHWFVPSFKNELIDVSLNDLSFLPFDGFIMELLSLIWLAPAKLTAQELNVVRESQV